MFTNKTQRDAVASPMPADAASLLSCAFAVKAFTVIGRFTRIVQFKNNIYNIIDLMNPFLITYKRRN